MDAHTHTRTLHGESRGGLNGNGWKIERERRDIDCIARGSENLSLRQNGLPMAFFSFPPSCPPRRKFSLARVR